MVDVKVDKIKGGNEPGTNKLTEYWLQMKERKG
jgi:hypothetical protein